MEASQASHSCCVAETHVCSIMQCICMQLNTVRPCARARVSVCPQLPDPAELQSLLPVTNSPASTRCQPSPRCWHYCKAQQANLPVTPAGDGSAAEDDGHQG